MGLLPRSRKSNEPEFDRLLAHDAQPRGEAEERLAEFVRQVAAFEEAPGRATESRHLAAIATAAREVAHGERTEPHPASGARRRRALPATKWRTALARNRPMVITAKLAAAVLALCVASAGLAVAGVTLPGPAGDAAGTLGLPNQAEENAQADDHSKASEALDRVRAEQARSQRGKPGTTGDGVSTQSHGEGHGIGEDVSNRTEQLREEMQNATTPQERKEAAQRFSEDVRNLAQDRERLPDQAESAPPSGLTQPQGGAQTGEEKSQDGRAIGEQVAGEHRP